MSSAADSKDSIQKVNADLQKIQARLQKIAWLEQNTSSKQVLSQVFKAQALICNAIAEIYTLTN